LLLFSILRASETARKPALVVGMVNRLRERRRAGPALAVSDRVFIIFFRMLQGNWPFKGLASDFFGN
jgi:hypothetical protein